jgi:RNA polymerase sigma-70 factor, ECF subfamily
MLRAKSDEDLLDVWRGGDRSAGKALFERYFDVLKRFFDTEVATGHAELVVETFRKCLEDQRLMNPKASFRAYLLGIAYGTLEAHLLKAERGRGSISGDESTERVMRNPSLLPDQAESSADMAGSSTAPDPAHEQDQRDEQRRQRALRMLPLMARVLLLLHDTELLPEEDIAAIIGIPVREVGHQLGRARFMLQRALERTGGNP